MKNCILLLLLLPISPVFAEEVTIGGESFEVELLYQKDFEGVGNRWRFDGRGRAWLEDGRLQMDADGFECTAWFSEQVEGDLAILYEARILDPVAPFGRGCGGIT